MRNFKTNKQTNKQTNKKNNERGLRFIEKNLREITRCFDEKNKMKLTLKSFAGFPLSLI